MSRRIMHVAAVVCVIFFCVMAVCLSEDTKKEVTTPVYPTATEAAPLKEESATVSADAVAEDTQEEAKATATPTPTAIPTPPAAEGGDDENSGCIGDDGLVW